jgi:hypothetical protein
MRMRATRTSATGCNARKRALTIGQLLPAGLGRVAFIGTDPNDPSWNEVYRQNRKALGPERVPQSAYLSSTGWQLSPGVTITGERAVATAAAQFGIAGYYQTVVPGQTYFVTTIVDSVAAGSVRPVLLGGTQVSGTTRTAPGVYFEVLRSVTGNDRFAVQFNGAGSNTATARVFAQEIADWSQIVLFNDLNGTEPIFDVREQKGLGLLLDRSFGLVRGPERVTNGTFDANVAGWTPQNANAPVWVAGQMSVTTTLGGGGEWQDVPVTAGQWYEVTSAWSLALAASLRVFDGANFTTTLAQTSDIAGPVARAGLWVRPTGSVIRVYLRSSGNGEQRFDNISVREVPGNHRQQPTAAARGEFSARYNMLTATEDFADPAWIRTSSAPGLVPTVTRDHGLAPNGINTADRLQMDGGAPGGNGLSQIRQSYLGAVVGHPVVWSLWMRSLAGPVAVSLFADQAVTSVTVTETWQRFTLPTNATSASGEVRIAKRDIWGTSGVADLLVWGAQVRLGADTAGTLPEYQAVRSPTDYDTVGFQIEYRSITDDSSFFDINPGGATQAYVFWAGRKLVDTTAIIMEASVNSTTGQGSFAVVQLAGSIQGRSGGSIPGASASAPNTAPNRLAFSMRSSIGQDILDVYSGKTRTSQNTADQGTGPYLPYRVFCGARAGTSLFQSTETFAPETVILLQSGDDLGATFARLQTAYSKAAGVPA